MAKNTNTFKRRLDTDRPTYWQDQEGARPVKGVIMSLALDYWMGDVHHCSGPPSPKWPILCRRGTLNSSIPYHTIGIFGARPPARPLYRCFHRQNLISWRRPVILHLHTQFGEDRQTQFRVIVVTGPQSHRQDQLQYTAHLASAQCYKHYHAYSKQVWHYIQHIIC